jgi:hypothetical protein
LLTSPTSDIRVSGVGSDSKTWCAPNFAPHGQAGEVVKSTMHIFFNPEFSSAVLIKPTRMGWAEHVVRMGRMRNACKMLVGISDRMRPLGRLKLRYEDNIKVYLREMWVEGVDWIYLAQVRNRGGLS